MNPNSTEYKQLNKVKVSIPDLRLQIVELMKDGFEEIPLGDLLFLIWRSDSTATVSPIADTSIDSDNRDCRS